jgi:hypothetical protein
MGRLAVAGLVLALAILPVACSDDDGDDGAGSAAEETASTSTAPAATPTSAPNRPLTGTLEPDTEYTVRDTVADWTMTFRTGADGGELILDYLPSGLNVSRAQEFVTALSVEDLSGVEVYEEPDPAAASLKPSPAPADLVGWLAARSFFEVVEPRRPFSAGDVTGEIVTVRTKPSAAVPNPNGCHPSAPICFALFRSRDGSGFTTSPGEVTDFAVVEGGGTKALVVAAHDGAGQLLLGSLRVSTG